MDILFYGVIALLVGIVVFLAFRVVKEHNRASAFKVQLVQTKRMLAEVTGDLGDQAKRGLLATDQALKAESQLALTKITLESIMNSTHDAMTREYVRTQLKKLQ